LGVSIFWVRIFKEINFPQKYLKVIF